MSIPRSGSNSTAQACAACKYRRRKCAPGCNLAPYFPHDRQSQFHNAHKLFGVSNISKIINNLDPSRKDLAMHTIVFQSDARANDPVGGCYRIIQQLQPQIEYSQAELDLVLHQLAICRTHVASHSTLRCEMVHPDLFNSYNPNFYYIQEPQEMQFAVNDDINNDDNNNRHLFEHEHETYDHSWGVQESNTSISSLNIG
ncbi:hypothetical protein GQ457_01G040540 [Hibiscus cannabinus]